MAYGREMIALNLASLADGNVPRDEMAMLAHYAQRAANGNRVTTTFRFQTGSSELDARAARDVGRLAAFLTSPAAAGRNRFI